MKELLTMSSNFYSVWTEQKQLTPQVEVVLVMSEPAYTVDAVGDVVRQRETTQCRFSASPQMLLRLAKAFTDLASEAEALLPPPQNSPTEGMVTREP